MKYLKIFEKNNNYETFKNSPEYITPNVSLIEENESLYYEQEIIPEYKNKAGDIAYWNGTKVVTIEKEKYTEKLGPSVGVVVIPKGFAPDGKTRIVSNYYVDENGNPSVEPVRIPFCEYVIPFDFNDNAYLPITDNMGSTTTGAYTSGMIPINQQDENHNVQSYIDPITYYDTSWLNGSLPMISSPYDSRDGIEKPNPEYYANLNGLENTKAFVNFSKDFIAANAAYKYTDGYSNLQWYLPTSGELVCLGARLYGYCKTQCFSSSNYSYNIDSYWGNSCGICIYYENDKIYHFNLVQGDFFGNEDISTNYVLPFAIID